MSRNLDHEIQQAKSRIGQMQRELMEKQAQLRELETLLADRNFGIRIGSVVLSKGSRYLVRNIEPFSISKPWVSGSPQKKDGSWSQSIRNLYEDWAPETAIKTTPEEAAE